MVQVNLNFLCNSWQVAILIVDTTPSAIFVISVFSNVFSNVFTCIIQLIKHI